MLTYGKNAQNFYNKNYLREKKTGNNEGLNMIIFNKRVFREIKKVSVESYNNDTKEIPILTNIILFCLFASFFIPNTCSINSLFIYIFGK